MLKSVNVNNLRHFSISPFFLQTHYETLGVGNDASQKDIKKAFYELSKKYHPDMNPGDLKKAGEMFSSISKAYEILSSDFSRKEYDQSIRTPPRGYSEMTSERFAQRRKEYTDINIDLKDFEAFQKAARSRRGHHEKYDMPDEFFARFGGKKFKSNYSEDSIPFTCNYKDKMSAEREAEELKIMEEIEKEKAKSRYPLPTFEQLIQEQNRKKMEESRRFNLVALTIMGSIILCVAAFSRLRRKN